MCTLATSSNVLPGNKDFFCKVTSNKICKSLCNTNAF
uniref:Uncharacterized protein n=1 Tax=Tetranychus urticae TaxID=32264 RepID=T1L2Y6_TETUR